MDNFFSVYLKGISILLVPFTIATMACSETNNSSDVENSTDSTSDVDTSTDTHSAMDENTDVGHDTVGDVSGMPIAPGIAMPKPSGTATNVTVLDWAGFKAALTYSFDDGQPSHISHYDALNEQGVPMTFFVSSGNSGLQNFDSTFSAAAADGHEIGNHTVRHCRANLSECSFGGGTPESAQAELSECSTYFADNFGQDNTYTMAAPYGDGAWAVPAEQYVFLNRGVNNGTIAPNDSRNAFALPTYMAAENNTAVDHFNPKIDKIFESGEWLIFCFHTILPTNQKWYANVELDDIISSMTHAKSMGDVWLDTMMNVGAYWLGQRTFNEIAAQSVGETTVWNWSLPDNFPSGKYLRVTVNGGTLTQNGSELPWSSHGYYEVALDAGELTLLP